MFVYVAMRLKTYQTNCVLVCMLVIDVAKLSKSDHYFEIIICTVVFY
jgi:hypothetical protein